MSRPNAGTKGVPRPDREQQILASASAVFGDESFSGTSVAAVAERAGISKPLIYSYFGSKEGLFTACLHHNGSVLAEEIERIARGEATGLERGLLTLEGIFTVLEPQPLIWRLFFDPTAPREGAIDQALRHYTDRISALAEEGVTELLQLAGNSDPLDVSAMTAAWMSIVDALVNWWLDHPDQSAAQMTGRCVRLVAALMPPSPAD